MIFFVIVVFILFAVCELCAVCCGPDHMAVDSANQEFHGTE